MAFWIAIAEAPLALVGLWMLSLIIRHILDEARSGWKEAACAHHGGHALKATRWYACRSCGYEATPEEVSVEMKKEIEGGAKFVILRPMGGG